MDPDADLAAVASLIADRHRAQMLLTLLGGTPQSGSALAEAAGISRSLASAHLKKLVAGGLVHARPSGRQQLYSVASESVADALEILILIAPASKVRSLTDATRVRSLRWARMCYDHLAGVVEVCVTEALIARGLLDEEDGTYRMGAGGAAEFNAGRSAQRGPLPTGIRSPVAAMRSTMAQTRGSAQYPECPFGVGVGCPYTYQHCAGSSRSWSTRWPSARDRSAATGPPMGSVG